MSENGHNTRNHGGTLCPKHTGRRLVSQGKKWQTPVQECQVQSLVCPREDQEQEVTVNALLATKSDHVLSAKLHLLSAKCFSCV